MINMLQFQICEITKNQMQYLCAFPQCYFDSNVIIDCYECLVDNHKHDRPNLDHIVQLPFVFEQSSQNINLAIAKLQYTLLENAGLSKTIQDDFKNVQVKILEIFQKMEKIVLTRLASITDKIKATQLELEQLIDSFDYSNEQQWRERTIYAISSTENILPNINILQLKINDIQDILKDMESTILNLDHCTNRLAEKINHNQKIQLYKLQCKCKVQDDTNDKVCLRHNQYDQYEKAKNESSLQRIQENQTATQRCWDEFINNETYQFQQSLSGTINQQLDQTFEYIFEQSTKDSIMCYDLQNNFTKIQLETQDKLEKSFDIFLMDITQISLQLMQKTVKIDRQQPQVDLNVRICSILMDKHNQNIGIDQKFKKEVLATLFAQDKQYLLGIEDQKNINIFKFVFRLKKSDCSGLYGDGDIVLGQLGSYVKFIQMEDEYNLDEIKVNNILELKNYSKNDNQDIKFQWQLFQKQ